MMMRSGDDQGSLLLLFWDMALGTVLLGPASLQLLLAGNTRQGKQVQLQAPRKISHVCQTCYVFDKRSQIPRLQQEQE